MRRSAVSPRSPRPSWTPRARSWGWRGCEQPAGADRPRPADRDRPRAVRGLRGLRQRGARRVQIGRRVGRRLPRAGGGRARAAAARVRCLPCGRDHGVGRVRPPDRPCESRPQPPVVTGLRLVLPRDPWPRLPSERATRVAIATIYALVLLVALAEVARSLARADRLDYAYYPELGEVVLSGGDPYANAFNTWPPFFLLVAAGLALGSRVSAAGTLFAWQLASVLAVWGTLKLLARSFEDGGAALTFWPRSPDRLAFVSSGVIVPFLFTARLFDDNLQHGPINALLLFLCLLAFVLFREQRLVAGGFALALAASLKAVPVLLLGYLAYKRRWRELGWSIAFLVLLNLVIPIALFGPGEAAAQWRAWRAVAAAEMVQPVAHHPNQALLSALKRLLTVEGGARNPIDYALAAWPTTAVVRLFWLVAGFAGLALTFAFRGSSRDLRDPRFAGEFAVCLGAMTLVSPLAWAAHFVTLVAPAAVAWAALPATARRAPGRGWRWGLWGGAFGCITLSAARFVGWAWGRRLRSLFAVPPGGGV